MIKCKLLVFIRCAGIILGVLISSSCAKHSNDLNENVYNRQFEPVELIPASFELEDPTGTINPRVIKSDGKHLYLLDFSTMSIQKFNLDGSYVGKIGKGIGQGPGEHTFVMDFHVRDTLALLADRSLSVVSVFNTDGRYLKSNYFPDIPIRVHSFGDHYIVQKFGGENLFSFVSLGNGTIYEDFGQLIEKQQQNKTSLSGVFIPTVENGFAYIPYFAGKLYFGSSSGTELTVLNSPDANPFPESDFQSSGFGRVIRAPNPDIIQSAADMNSKIIYVFVLHQGSDGKKSRYFLDMYSAIDGSYKSSIEISFFWKDFVVQGDEIFVLRNSGEVEKYQFQYR